MSGTLRVGTSGFSYPGWSPRFYPPGTRALELLPYYASRLDAVELNATFRARPTPTAIARWVASTPETFRFSVKAQRGAAVRAIGGRGSPEESVAWLTEPLEGFGDRLAAVLFRIPEEIPRRGRESDERLRRLVAAWPSDLSLVLEPRHASWLVDETFATLREGGAILCATELPEDEVPPTIRLTGSALYLRLRRHDYTDAEIEAWARRLEPFLAAGHDVLAFFRHDEVGRGPELAMALRKAAGAAEVASPSEGAVAGGTDGRAGDSEDQASA